MGNQNCTKNCNGLSLNDNIIQIGLDINNNKIDEELEIIEKVKSSKQGNWEEKCN